MLFDEEWAHVVAGVFALAAVLISLAQVRARVLIARALGRTGAGGAGVPGRRALAPCRGMTVHGNDVDVLATLWQNRCAASGRSFCEVLVVQTDGGPAHHVVTGADPMEGRTPRAAGSLVSDAFEHPHTRGYAVCGIQTEWQIGQQGRSVDPE